MIDLYTWPTPNGHKVHIMLEECGLPYAVHAVDITAGDQYSAEFQTLSPNSRIPAIVDHDGPDGRPISLFESGAILVYLAGKTGRMLPRTDRERFRMLEWLMWQVGGFGPMLGQAQYFNADPARRETDAAQRFTAEAQRLYRVLDAQLNKTRAFVAGRQYTIADIAIFPWCRASQEHGVALDDYPATRRWFDQIEGRPAVKRALQVLDERRRAPLGEVARAVLLGNGPALPT